jgi:hypothetical protein
MRTLISISITSPVSAWRLVSSDDTRAFEIALRAEHQLAEQHLQAGLDGLGAVLKKLGHAVHRLGLLTRDLAVVDARGLEHARIGHPHCRGLQLGRRRRPLPPRVPTR